MTTEQECARDLSIHSAPLVVAALMGVTIEALTKYVRSGVRDRDRLTVRPDGRISAWAVRCFGEAHGGIAGAAARGAYRAMLRMAECGQAAIDVPLADVVERSLL